MLENCAPELQWILILWPCGPPPPGRRTRRRRRPPTQRTRRTRMIVRWDLAIARRINTEEKANVVSPAWGREFIECRARYFAQGRFEK